MKKVSSHRSVIRRRDVQKSSKVEAEKAIEGLDKTQEAMTKNAQEAFENVPLPDLDAIASGGEFVEAAKDKVPDAPTKPMGLQMFMLGKSFDAKKEGNKIEAAIDGEGFATLEKTGSGIEAQLGGERASLKASKTDSSIAAEAELETEVGQLKANVNKSGDDKSASAALQTKNRDFELNAKTKGGTKSFGAKSANQNGQSHEANLEINKGDFDAKLSTTSTSEDESRTHGAQVLREGKSVKAHLERETQTKAGEQTLSAKDKLTLGVGEEKSVAFSRARETTAAENKSASNFEAALSRQEGRQNVKASLKSEKSEGERTRSSENAIDAGFGGDEGLTLAANHSSHKSEGEDSQTHEASFSRTKSRLSGGVKRKRIRTREGKKKSSDFSLDLSRNKGGPVEGELAYVNTSESDAGTKSFSASAKREAGLSEVSIAHENETEKEKSKLTFAAKKEGDASEASLAREYENEKGSGTLSASGKRSEKGISGKAEWTQKRKDGTNTRDKSASVSRDEDGTLNATAAFENVSSKKKTKGSASYTKTKKGEHAFTASVEREREGWGETHKSQSDVDLSVGEKGFGGNLSHKAQSEGHGVTRERDYSVSRGEGKTTASARHKRTSDKGELETKATYTKTSDEQSVSLNATSSSKGDEGATESEAAAAFTKKKESIEAEVSVKRTRSMGEHSSEVEADAKGTWKSDGFSVDANARHHKESEGLKQTSTLGLNIDKGVDLKGSIVREREDTTHEASASFSNKGGTYKGSVEGKKEERFEGGSKTSTAKAELSYKESLSASAEMGFEKTKGEKSLSAKGSATYAGGDASASVSASHQNKARTVSGSGNASFTKGVFNADANAQYETGKFAADANASLTQERFIAGATYASKEEGATKKNVSFTKDKSRTGIDASAGNVSAGFGRTKRGYEAQANYKNDRFGGGFQFGRAKKSVNFNAGHGLKKVGVVVAGKASKEATIVDLGADENDAAMHRVVVNQQTGFAGDLGMRLKAGLFGGRMQTSAQRIKHQQWITSVKKEHVAAFCEKGEVNKPTPDPKDPRTIPVGDALRLETKGNLGLSANLSVAGIKGESEVMVRGEFEMMVERHDDNTVVFSAKPSKVRGVSVEGKAVIGMAGFKRNWTQSLGQTFKVNISTREGMRAYEKALQGGLPQPDISHAVDTSLRMIDDMNASLPEGVDLISLAEEKIEIKGHSFAIESAGIGFGFAKEYKQSIKKTHTTGNLVQESASAQTRSKKKLFSGKHGVEIEASLVHESQSEGSKNEFRSIDFSARLFDTKARTKDLEHLIREVSKVIDVESPKALKASGEARRVEVKIQLDEAVLTAVTIDKREEILKLGKKAGIESELLQELSRGLRKQDAGARAMALQRFVSKTGLDGFACVARTFSEVERTMVADVESYERRLDEVTTILSHLDQSKVKVSLDGEQGSAFVEKTIKVGKHFDALRAHRQTLAGDPLLDTKVREGLLERCDALIDSMQSMLDTSHLSFDERVELAKQMARPRKGRFGG